MPRYDFTCMECDKTVEKEMVFNSNEMPVCESCGNFMIKVFTPPAIHFKGGGWGGQ